MLHIASCTCSLDVVCQAPQANRVEAVVHVYSVCVCLFVVQGTWNRCDCTRCHSMVRLALRARTMNVATEALQAKAIEAFSAGLGVLLLIGCHDVACDLARGRRPETEFY